MLKISIGCCIFLFILFNTLWFIYTVNYDTRVHGRRQRGAGPWPPLDFNSCYKYGREMLKSAIFGVFCYFSVYFPFGPPSLEESQ